MPQLNLTNLECLSTGWLTMGKKVREFEDALCEYLGCNHAVMVNSGSSANLLAFSVLKQVRPDVETVTFPIVLWPTTFWAAHLHDFLVKWHDVDLETLCLKSTCYDSDAICAVHLLGQVCQCGTEPPGPLIEDACDAIGAEYAFKKVGTRGLMGTFSFFYSHHINTIEGGAVVTDDDECYHNLLMQRAHGWTRELPDEVAEAYGGKGKFVFASPGFNVRPTEFAAELGLQQIKHIDDDLAARRAIVETLSPGLTAKYPGHAWFGYPILCENKEERDHMMARCQDEGLEARPIMSGNFARQPVAKQLNIQGEFPNADRIHDCGFYIMLARDAIDAMKPYARVLR